MSTHHEAYMSSSAPMIVLSDSDRDRLWHLATAARHGAPDVAGVLLGEVERAEVVPENAVPKDAVSMQSYVQFRDDETGELRTVQIVYPRDADIARAKISVLTPIGATLIGLSEGQSMLWRTRDGRLRSLTVIKVRSSWPLSEG
jgi:regulator of nucleoside diphosphate kinase